MPTHDTPNIVVSNYIVQVKLQPGILLGMLGVKAKYLRTYVQDLSGGDGMAWHDGYLATLIHQTNGGQT